MDLRFCLKSEVFCLVSSKGVVKMRKIIVLEHVSLDGVIQSPGGQDEDVSEGFTYGGWTGPFASDELGRLIRTQMHSDFALLLGRKTYEQWGDYWPHHADVWPEAQIATKYVASQTLQHSIWEPTVFLKDPIKQLTLLKLEAGPDFHVWGSSDLAHALFQNGLVDDCWLIIYPIIIGSGKRLFPNGDMNPITFTSMSHHLMPNGVVVSHYQRK